MQHPPKEECFQASMIQLSRIIHACLCMKDLLSANMSHLTRSKKAALRKRNLEILKKFIFRF